MPASQPPAAASSQHPGPPATGARGSPASPPGQTRAARDRRTEGPPTGLRQRRREELIEEVLDVARRHLVTEGAAGMSVRAIARDIGIAPSALYRYFPSRDDLLTVLIRRTYVEIDAMLEAAVSRALATYPADPSAAWVAATLEYRAWALGHPEEFALVYGTPVPGYRAPEEATRQVGQQAGQSLGRIVVAAVEQGLVVVEPVAMVQSRMSEPMQQHLTAVATGRGLAVPHLGGADGAAIDGAAIDGVATGHNAPADGVATGDPATSDPTAALFSLGLGAWAKLQGLVAMELFGHLPPTGPHAEEFFRLESAALVERFVRAPA